jgi:hypothetical protein
MYLELIGTPLPFPRGGHYFSNISRLFLKTRYWPPDLAKEGDCVSILAFTCLPFFWPTSACHTFARAPRNRDMGVWGGFHAAGLRPSRLGHLLSLRNSNPKVSGGSKRWLQSTEATLPAEADVVVIGGGSAGASALYHCQQRGLSAVLLEKVSRCQKRMSGACEDKGLTDGGQELPRGGNHPSNRNPKTRTVHNFATKFGSYSY